MSHSTFYTLESEAKYFNPLLKESILTFCLHDQERAIKKFSRFKVSGKKFSLSDKPSWLRKISSA